MESEPVKSLVGESSSAAPPALNCQIMEPTALSTVVELPSVEEAPRECLSQETQVTLAMMATSLLALPTPDETLDPLVDINLEVLLPIELDTDRNVALHGNVCGLNSKEKQLDVHKFLSRNLVPIISLIETKVQPSLACKVQRKVLPHHRILNSLSSGRIWVLWQDNLMDLMLISFLEQFVHCKASPVDGSPPFFLTTIYASNSFSDRLTLWDDLEELAAQTINSPWIIGGDFNEVRFSNEKIGARSIYSQRALRFNQCIESCHLNDLCSIGGPYSLSNNQDNRIACKLDRALVNTNWISSFPDSFIQLQHTKAILKQWNCNVFGPVQQQLLSSRVILESARNDLSLDPLNPILISFEAQAKSKYLDLLHVEESFLRQKSRQMWLSDGDRNSQFFHSMVKSRIARNSIRSEQLQDGSFQLIRQLLRHLSWSILKLYLTNSAQPQSLNCPPWLW
ncbi:hypothetical protein QJS04_geneDACA010725 [Acorus gramineus]|uniref:Endonuclease/exonuclease/phosphatase domain-containing protein n=1 Tax=Acorus gramineus TaxID=55184 RepID=A0AAV9BBF4_ACOGR|nr:hypothetical protein QJS04_geneDACA010725 [Acorus gramineus]